MQAALLVATAKAACPSEAIIRRTGMPIPHGAVTLLKQGVLGQFVLLHVVVDVAPVQRSSGRKLQRPRKRSSGRMAARLSV